MIAIGNFLFHFRNILFPLFYAGLFIPSPDLFASYKTAALIGLAISLLGQGLRVITIGLVYIVRGGKNRRIYAEDLVTSGMFNHCRNPLYIGNILLLLGMGVMANSVLFIAVFIPFFLFVYQAIVMAEEQFLLNKFGNDFRDYMKNVNRWMPNLSGLSETLRSMRFRWKRVMIREYNSALVWIIGALIVIMKNVYTEDGEALFNQLLPSAVTVLILSIVGYSTIRYLKKSKKLRDE